MTLLIRRTLFWSVAICVSLWTFLYFLDLPQLDSFEHLHRFVNHPHRPQFRWKHVKQRYPVESFRSLPTGPAQSIPQIQHTFQPETPEEKRIRESRRDAVRDSFLHSWKGYKSHAWLHDEVSPITGSHKNGYGGWAATLVDSLDTLWIMGLQKEFAVAVSALKHIDLTTSPLEKINVFETNIRYLGGLLSAYDVSGGKYKALLRKAVELGDMLYVAFDTPNRMPITHWDWLNGAMNGPQETPLHVALAEYGSFTLEFTRLSQVTGDPKYYDAVQRVMDVFDRHQDDSKIPGLWPMWLNPQAQGPEFSSKDTTFTMGAMADSLYEYLPKQHLLLGGHTDQYARMYEKALATAKERLFFKPLTPENHDILFSGVLKRLSAVNIHLTKEGTHLTCFVGGMVGLGARAFGNDSELLTARQLTDGCIWAYESMPSGIMPEVFLAKACTPNDCEWSNERWYEGIRHDDTDANSEARRLPLEQRAKGVIERQNLVPGFTRIKDPRYILRPEAIESVFVMYRITGDKTLQDKAWNMFSAINSVAKTDIAYAEVQDVSVVKSELTDSMESFWTAETLKYFYLIFSEPDLISLDDFVLNTEAHPLLRPKA